MNAHELFREGKRQLALGDPQGCIDLVSKSMKSGRVSTHQLLTRAAARMRLQQYQESLADCDEAMEIDPENRHLYFIRGAVLRRMNRLDDAIANLNQAIDINPEYGIAYLERALCYTAAGRQSEADQDFKTVLRFTETALQGFCDSMGMIHTQVDAVEALLDGDRDYPRLFLSAEEFEQMKRALN
ncbi:MAG: tetratricopeptide repeat protein [Magnetococcus sp. XQGC-1]